MRQTNRSPASRRAPNCGFQKAAAEFLTERAQSLPPDAQWQCRVLETDSHRAPRRKHPLDITAEGVLFQALFQRDRERQNRQRLNACGEISGPKESLLGNVTSLNRFLNFKALGERIVLEA